MKKLICDFCKEREAEGVYATDHGPFSLCYCSECLKYPNIRTPFNGLSKWARLGDAVFKENSEWTTNDGKPYPEPNVYYKGEYLPLRKLIDIININDLIDILPVKNSLYGLIYEKLKEYKKI